MEKETEQELIKKMIGFQKEEITSSIIYRKLAVKEKDIHNREILQRIAEDESRHYATLRGYTHQDVSPNRFEICFYVWLVRLLGVTFAVRRLELGEKETSGVYSQYPSMEHFAEMARDEQHHEEKLIEMIDEERLQYMGSVVLGLNDALVEFTGALAGFTLALNDTKLIALTGSITGIAAALSMASSEYLSTKSEKTHNKRPVKAAIYTGIAYIITVVALMASGITDSSLKFHLQNAKDHGVTQKEIAAIITHIAFYAGWPKAWAVFNLAKEVWVAGEGDLPYEEEAMRAHAKKMVFPIGTPNDGFAQYFSGRSFLAPISTSQVGIFNVTFEPGCRNNWHIHHAKSGGGQILVCVAGRGYYQEEGKDAVEMKPGDCINIPAEVKHWHGAAPDEWFSHLAIEVPGENSSNEWLEPVSDEEYGKLQ